MSNADKPRAAHEAFNARDFKAAAAAILEPNGSFVDHGRGVTLRSHTEFVGWLEDFVAMASDLQIIDARYIDGGDWVTTMFRAVGTQDGPMDPFPASGKPFSLDVCEVYHFTESGLADEAHNYSDGLGLLMQLGHLPTPG